jgi:branched-chain amino acid transport system substrate-binding protein
MRRLTGLGALLLALALVAVATASGATKGSASSTRVASAASASECGNGKASTVAGTSVGGSIPTANLGDSSYGQSSPGSCNYSGPGDFSINIKKSCPAGWKINQGITSKSINLFTSMPHSGALAAYGYIGDGIESYLKYVNAHGGVDGRSINYTIKDDQYEPQLTQQNAEAAIQSGQYAAGFAILGSSNNAAITNLMNQQCMGDFMTAASDDMFGNMKLPWTTPFGLDYDDEAALWVSYLKTMFPQGAKIAEITLGNDFGDSYVSGVARAIKGTKFTIAANEVHSQTAPTITNQITSAAATGAKIAILNEAGTFCTQAIADIQQSSWHPLIIASNACAQISTVLQPLQAEGLTGNGLHVIRYYYSPTDPDEGDPTFSALYTKVLKSQGLDPTNAQYANGWFWGWYIVQVLRDASVLKGGLNRANILIANHSYDSTYPLMVKGVKGQMDGAANDYPFGSGAMYTYADATTSKLGEWVKQGPLLSYVGDLHNWAYVQSH